MSNKKRRLVITLRDDINVAPEEIAQRLCDKGMVLLHSPLKHISIIYGEFDADLQVLREVEGVAAVEPEEEMYS